MCRTVLAASWLGWKETSGGRQSGLAAQPGSRRCRCRHAVQARVPRVSHFRMFKRFDNDALNIHAFICLLFFF